MAVVAAALFLILPRRGVMASLGFLSVMMSAGLGAFHTGVEKGWWQGPTSCTGADVGSLSASELMDQILAAPLIQCDQVAWSFLGLSMASWNAVFSLLLAGIWFLAILDELTKTAAKDTP